MIFFPITFCRTQVPYFHEFFITSPRRIATFHFSGDLFYNPLPVPHICFDDTIFMAAKFDTQHSKNMDVSNKRKKKLVMGVSRMWRRNDLLFL